MRIQQFRVRHAADHEYAAMNRLMNRIRMERLPDDPPMSLEEDIQRWRNVPDYVDVHAWGVWGDDESEFIAEGNVAFFLADHNRHMGEFGISVLPEFRRRGLATMVLALIAEAAQQEHRTLLITSTFEHVPAGQLFMERLGARMGLPMHINQLDLRDLDRNLMREWQDRAKDRAFGFELLVWTEGAPDEHVEAFVNLVEAMNLAPRGDLQVEDFHLTPEQLRQHEHQDRARGIWRWTMIARERGTGRFAGFTEVTGHPGRPALVSQGATAVLMDFQNKGLGRWLKAAMLAKVLAERPEARFVRTGNADSNAPMLKINHQLGFKPYQSQLWWQVELAQVQTYLASRTSQRGTPVPSP